MAGLFRLPPPRERHNVDSALAIVNIVLLLIFFFITTGTLSSSINMTVALPETAELPLDQLPKPLLTVTADNALSLDGVAIERGSLAEALIDDPIVHILADRDSSAADLLDLLAGEELIAVEVRLVTVHRKDGDAAQ